LSIPVTSHLINTKFIRQLHFADVEENMYAMGVHVLDSCQGENKMVIGQKKSKKKK
jgi:hypothetical protein